MLKPRVSPTLNFQMTFDRAFGKNGVPLRVNSKQSINKEIKDKLTFFPALANALSQTFSQVIQWLHRAYYLFNFLASLMAMMGIACNEVSLMGIKLSNMYLIR